MLLQQDQNQPERQDQPAQPGNRRQQRFDAAMELLKRLNGPALKEAKEWQEKVQAQQLKPGDKAVVVLKDPASGQHYYVPIQVRKDMSIPGLSKLDFTTPYLDTAAVKKELVDGKVLTAEEADKLSELPRRGQQWRLASAFLQGLGPGMISPLQPVGVLKSQAKELKETELNQPNGPRPKTLDADAISGQISVGKPQVALVYDENGYSLRPFQAKQARGGGSSWMLEAESPEVPEELVESLKKQYGLKELPVQKPTNVLLSRLGHGLRFGTTAQAVVDIVSLETTAEPGTQPNPGTEPGPPKPEPKKEPTALKSEEIAAKLKRGADVALVVQDGGVYSAIPVKVNFVRGNGTSFGITAGSEPSKEQLAKKAEELGIEGLGNLTTTQRFMAVTKAGEVRIGSKTYPKVIGIIEKE